MTFFKEAAQGFLLFNMALNSEAAVSEVKNCIFWSPTNKSHCNPNPFL